MVIEQGEMKVCQFVMLFFLLRVKRCDEKT